MLRSVAVAFLLVLTTTTVRAGVIPADALPIPNRVALADAIVAGKVTAIEEKAVTVPPFPGAKNVVEYRIAVVTVAESFGTAAARTVRVAFVQLKPGIMIRPQPFQASVDLEGCFFLKKHEGTDFFMPSGALPFLNKKSDSFEKDLAAVKRCSALLASANDSLKAKSAEDRFVTAAMLLAQYRTRKTQMAKEEPIDAEQSKLILQALAGADWTQVNDFSRISPLMVLHRLSLTAADGWMPPDRKDAKAYAAYAQKWVGDHAEKYRIRRFVSVEKTR